MQMQLCSSERQNLEWCCNARREFTINLISEWFVEAAHHTCGNYDRGVDEIELSGLTPVPSVKVQNTNTK